MERRTFGDVHWQQPLRWIAAAAGARSRPRVFCASMADVFEDREELNPWRARLWTLIEATPNLDWLLLTKRPSNVKRMAGWGLDWPENVWLGTTVELQARAEELLPYLAENPATVRFISAEPLLGPLSIKRWLGTSINWVITGAKAARKRAPRLLLGSASFTFSAWSAMFHFTSSNGAIGHPDTGSTFLRSERFKSRWRQTARRWSGSARKSLGGVWTVRSGTNFQRSR